MEKIQQTIEFVVSPEEFYYTILDAGKHSSFTQSKAVINDVVGDSYVAYDGYIEGTNLNLIPGKLIVQSWKESYWDKLKVFFKK
jgi:hypothetical protein